MSARNIDALPSAQRGVVLLLILAVIGLASTIVLLLFSDKAEILTAKNERISASIYKTLTDKQMKTALISWATMPFGSYLGQSSATIGQLPYPDVAASGIETPTNYNGDPNVGCLSTSGTTLVTSGSNMRCLGRLPWRALGLPVTTPSEPDSTGIMPWYAVSANLMNGSCASLLLNPSLLNLTYPGTSSCNSSQLPYPWLTVRDARGNVLSNRVAVVIIMPGPAIGNQVRPTSPLAGASAYLDSVTVKPGCTAPCVPGTYNNASLNPGNDFIQGLDGSQVAANDPNFAQPYYFNDRVIYITIDDLMAAVEKRAAMEARAKLLEFYRVNQFFPYAALLGDASSACLRNIGATSVHAHDHDHGWGINHDHNDTYPTHQHTHDSTRGSLPLAQGNCGAGNYLGGNPASSALASWFTANQWQHYIYYTVAPACIPSASAEHPDYGTGGNNGNNKAVGNAANNSNTTTITTITLSCTNAAPNNTFLKVGSDTHVMALLINTGRPIANVVGQIPAMTTPPYAWKGSDQTGYPSNRPIDYLDSQVNVQGATAFSAAQGKDIYDAVNTPRNATYNDQMTIVAH